MQKIKEKNIVKAMHIGINLILKIKIGESYTQIMRATLSSAS